MLPWRHILLATDLSPCSDNATEAAIELALRFEAALTVVHVWEIPTYLYTGAMFSAEDLLTPVEQAAVEALRLRMELVHRRLPGAQAILRRGVPAHQLLTQIGESAPDLVVIGTHGRHGASHLLLGSVAEKVVRQSPAPVLTVRSAAG